MENSEAVPLTQEEAKDAREVMQHQRDLKAHLKSLSKNELIQTVIQIAQALAMQLDTNKTLNENLKILLKEQKNEENSVNSPAITEPK